MLRHIRDSYTILEDVERSETVVFWGDESFMSMDSIDPVEQAKLYRSLADHLLDEAFYLENDPEREDLNLLVTGRDKAQQIQKMMKENPNLVEPLPAGPVIVVKVKKI